MADQKLCLKWNDFQDQAQTSFQELRNDNDFTDVTLACEDKSIKAHKVILSAGSTVFKKLLTTYPHPQPLIYMKGMKSNSLTAIVDFLYLGEANIVHGDLEIFLALAEELQLKGFPSSSEEETAKYQSPSSNHTNMVAGTATYPKRSPFKYTERVANSNQKKNMSERKMSYVKFDMEAKAFEDTLKTYQQKWQQRKKSYSIIEPGIMARIETMIQRQPEGYNCTNCDYTTKNRSHMIEHVEKHIEGLEYPCNVCNKTFRTSVSFRIHNNRCAQS